MTSPKKWLNILEMESQIVLNFFVQQMKILTRTPSPRKDISEVDYQKCVNTTIFT